MIFGRVGSSFLADVASSDEDELRVDDRYASDSGGHTVNVPFVDVDSIGGVADEEGFQRVMGRCRIGKKDISKDCVSASTSSHIVTRKGRRKL